MRIDSPSALGGLLHSVSRTSYNSSLAINRAFPSVWIAQTLYFASNSAFTFLKFLMNTLQELLEPKRASSNLSDTDIRRIAIDSIAVQFLNTESTGEIREYLVDTTLPQLVMALERLLKKVSQSPDINAPKLPRKTANDLDSPIHVQKQPFDCVIWLAQDLMRNNHSKEKSMYEIRMMEISKELHKKIAELKVVEIDNANRIKYQLIAENSAASELSDQLNRHLTVLFYDCLRSVNLMVTSNVSVVLLVPLFLSTERIGPGCCEP